MANFIIDIDIDRFCNEEAQMSSNGILISDVSTYTDGDGNNSHNRENFKYMRCYVRLPNGQVIEYSSDALNIRFKMSLPVNYRIEQNNCFVSADCLSGIFKVRFIAVPSPIVGGTSFIVEGEVFYWKGKFYLFQTVLFISGSTEQEITNNIQQYVNTGDVTVITENELPPKYFKQYFFNYTCGYFGCLVSKLSKFNCMVAKSPFISGICEMKLFQEVQMLLSALQIMTGLKESEGLVSDDTLPFEDLPLYIEGFPNIVVTKVLNTVNSICCCNCKDCKCGCSDCGVEVAVEEGIDYDAILIEKFKCLTSDLDKFFCGVCACGDICKKPDGLAFLKAVMMMQEIAILEALQTDIETVNKKKALFAKTLSCLCPS